MKKLIAAVATAWLVGAGGAHAQTRTYVIHFDNSCEGLRLHVLNGTNVTGETIGCAEASRKIAGRIGTGDVATVTSADHSAVRLRYVVDLRKHTWSVYDVADRHARVVAGGFWTRPELAGEADVAER